MEMTYHHQRRNQCANHSKNQNRAQIQEKVAFMLVRILKSQLYVHFVYWIWWRADLLQLLQQVPRFEMKGGSIRMKNIKILESQLYGYFF